ncbi:MAG: DNA polymerase I [Veillonellaceae bacterium]|nr:DNA polymerase I [Veillonellaceae bacterium]
MKKLMIIDGSSLLYRAFFALPPLKNALGIPTNAVYGFLTMLVKLYETIGPDYVAIAFDKGKQTFRTELYPDYKGNRPEAPDDLRPQFALIREVLAALGLPVIEEEGFEGDDIMGSLSRQWASKDLPVYIVSGDRDTLQLVTDTTTVYITKKGISDMLEVTPETMPFAYGYEPNQVIDMKALMGDSSDNIPGVPGVGEKTALKLLTQFGSLDEVYAHLDQVSGKKLKEKLADNKDKAYLSKELATIKTDMKLVYQLEDFLPQVHVEEVKPLFEKLGFHKVTPKLLQAMHVNDQMALDDGSGDSLFASPKPIDIAFITSDQVKEEFYKDKMLSLYLRIEGKLPFPKNLATYVYNGADWVKIAGSKEENINLLLTMTRQAKALVTDSYKTLLELLGQSLPAAIPYRDEKGEPRVWDVSLMAYLLDPTRTNYGISYLCERFGLSQVPSSGLDEEFALTAKAFHDMYLSALKALEEQGLYDLYKTIELPLVHTLAVMEKNGIYIDPEALAATKVRFEVEVKALQEEIYQLAGSTFNISSPKQLGVVLFETLGLPVIKKTKTGYSTDAEVLDTLRTEHPIVDKILAYRSVVKLVSTYLDGLKPLINPVTHRIHTSFNQMVTATGRLSSSEPNLQNIPVRTEKGKEIRALFLPGRGYDWLMSADYSQIELRILAHLSEDEALIKAFNDGADIHRFTASEILGKKPEEVTAEERSHAKAVNFGIIYGISDYGLSRDLGISRKAAKDYIDLYFSRYPKVKAYMDAMIAKAHKTGEVHTMFGRVRSLPDINSRNFNRRSFAERTAMNTPIQGTAADIIKLAMNQVENRLEAEGYQSRLLLQVHDELVLEVLDSEAEAIEALLNEIMDKVVELRVPLIVDVHKAKNWAAIK